MTGPTYDESAIVDVRGLTKSYGQVRAVAGLDLRIGRGEIFALLGPNGAGKTSTVEMKQQIGIVLQSTGWTRTRP
jgi:ABC-type multidrug transport system ATPase subunit